ncbi:hypothetical protein A2165_00245 [Candidatus Curtissbacteria bacterium RBG_13_40_7]|uniref:Uncharacterized protein n=1 Tax=Candidatus Curtissbacteria bacterium RBG_13_40_7 TaxID=1797706 RepID=A0A1F5FWJ0_9BACT|nr:MAG: hypothetical protein A2165_00245 [Candidatus Curtissbacteria bacterium RBG_13_40_7]
MEKESGGGNQCAVGGANEIGVFQYTAGTWAGSTNNPTADSGSGTLDQYLNDGRTVCWRILGADPNLDLDDTWFSWIHYFGPNIDGEAWNPYKQIEVTSANLQAGMACNWTSYSGANTPDDPTDGLHPENCD